MNATRLFRPFPLLLALSMLTSTGCLFGHYSAEQIEARYQANMMRCQQEAHQADIARHREYPTVTWPTDSMPLSARLRGSCSHVDWTRQEEYRLAWSPLERWLGANWNGKDAPPTLYVYPLR
jgi:hypothetical protein